MNYSNMTTAGMQPSSASISLPPISTIDFRTHPAHHHPQEVVQPLPPPPPRQLPPLPYSYSGVRYPQQPEYMQQQQRPLYPTMHGIPGPYQLVSSRMPLPSHNTDPNLMVAPARHKTKEVKRRTKTGCLTCRKRRIKCDEGRPECRNCMKSKRNCLGYDPVFQPSSNHSIHPAPTGHQNNASASPSNSSSNQPRRFDTGSPSTLTNLSTSLPSSTASDFSYSKPSDALPHLNQPYRMDNHGQNSLSAYSGVGRPRRTIEEICTIPGTKLPSVPAIPPNQVPNLDSIRKVYDIAFAPGLDKFLESSQHWYATVGFDLLANNRSLLGLVLAYLTLVSGNHDNPIHNNATLVSQEARVTWGLLGLCTQPNDHGADQHETLARRFRVVESLLTGEPLGDAPSSMSEFVHQEPEPEPEVKETETKQSTFEKQVNRRMEEYWATLEAIATNQATAHHDDNNNNVNTTTAPPPPPSSNNTADTDTHVTAADAIAATTTTTAPATTAATTATDHDDGNIAIDEKIMALMEKIKTLLDGRENRDIIYSILLLRWGHSGGRNGNGESSGSGARELARRFLENQAQGRATDLVGGDFGGHGVEGFCLMSLWAKVVMEIGTVVGDYCLCGPASMIVNAARPPILE